MVYSVIVPVYNRPDEIDELLESLTQQSFKDFEVIIVEDGSEERCEEIIKNYHNRLSIRYYYKENSGQGFSRNYGFEKANGDYYVVFDSDCLIPPDYFEKVNQFLASNPVDCWGGPDKAHPSFTNVQKAISYSMTSFLTTGGIRGRKKHLGTFHPRSFNMGISKEVFEKTGGYKITRMGEDIEFSIRILENGFTSVLIPDAYVYHKRRTNLKQFYKQLHFFGRARINIHRFYPDELKAVHFFPVIFLIGILVGLILIPLNFSLASVILGTYLIYGSLLFIDSYKEQKSFKISVLATYAGYIQLIAYAIGFLKELTVFNSKFENKLVD